MAESSHEPGRTRQREIFLGGLAGEVPDVPTDYRRLKERARSVMSTEGFAYAEGGAGLERTMAANRDAFHRWRIVPRMLRGPTDRDLGVTLFGSSYASPFFLSPIGVLEMAHGDADLAAARAAASQEIPLLVSSQASYSMEECAEAAGSESAGARRLWFQLYWNRSREIVESFVRRAEAAGYAAIVLTLDTSSMAWRPRDLDLGHLPFLRGKGIAQYVSDPVFRRQMEELSLDDSDDGPPLTLDTIFSLVELNRRFPGSFWENLRTSRPRKAVQHFISTFSHAFLSWDDVTFLRELTDLPLILKGILHPDDAERGVEAGVDGILVSNHGGRQIDGGVGALEALPGVVGRVGGRVPVLMDSGIRTGSDAFKALALGASAVGIGRPYMYGLALAGERGVREVVRNLVADLDLTMTIAGTASISEIRPELLEAAS
ncbi:MAG: alpha-hydroxy-acid oxidizing protein [Longimicrobiales bacterium]|nr:alpha-hydroxy-acid oxidizing protein [Longimicrobiales bacterium]